MNSKRMSVTFSPEWENELKTLKKERFYDKSTAEMIRYLIQQGLKVTKNVSQNYPRTE